MYIFPRFSNKWKIECKVKDYEMAKYYVSTCMRTNAIDSIAVQIATKTTWWPL